MKRSIIAIVIAVVAFSACAESPIKVNYNHTWYQVAKKAITNTVKSITIELDVDAAKELAKDGLNKSKELGAKAIDKIKEHVEIREITTETGNPSKVSKTFNENEV